MALPADLAHWLIPHVGLNPSATDASWDRPDSQVWRVIGNTGGDVYVKISSNSAAHAREVAAYQHAAQVLGPGEAPVLVDSDPQLGVIVTTPLPGTAVRGTSLDVEEEQQVHAAAGALLRRWHDSASPEPADRDDVRVHLVRQAAEAARYRHDLIEYLTTEQHAVLQRAANELPGLAEMLPLAYRHGDYSPRNWLWHREREQHGLIDFEEAVHGAAVEDLVWLHGAVWPTRPDLQQAFLTGYDRALNAEEQHALHLITAKVAVSCLHTGLHTANQTLIDRGRTALDHLLADGPPS